MLSVLANAPKAFVLFAATTTTTSKTSSLASSGFLIVLLIIVGAYLLFIRPQRMKMRQQMSATPINVGDEVITQSGIIGRVVRFEGERVVVQVAPGTNVMVHRTALGRRVEARDLDYYSPSAPGSSFDDTPPEDGTASPPPGAAGDEDTQESGDSSPSSGSPT